MADLSRSGGALNIHSYISAEGHTPAGRQQQVSNDIAQSSRSRLSLPRSRSLVPAIQVQIHKIGKAGISGKCVQAKGRCSQTIAISPKGCTSKPQCKRAIATTMEVGAGEREDT